MLAVEGADVKSEDRGSTGVSLLSGMSGWGLSVDTTPKKRVRTITNIVVAAQYTSQSCKRTC